jgi:hypothetical protein
MPCCGPEPIQSCLVQRTPTKWGVDEGDMAGAETWHRILNAIERRQAKAPATAEKVH